MGALVTLRRFVDVESRATPEQANERSAKLAGQFIMDMHTHFLRPGTRIMGFVAQRNAVGKAGWNAAGGHSRPRALQKPHVFGTIVDSSAALIDSGSTSGRNGSGGPSQMA